MSGKRCSSVFEGLPASELFFYPPQYEDMDSGSSLAANALAGTPEIDGEQIGGVCLQKMGFNYPDYLEVSCKC